MCASPNPTTDTPLNSLHKQDRVERLVSLILGGRLAKLFGVSADAQNDPHMVAYMAVGIVYGFMVKVAYFDYGNSPTVGHFILHASKRRGQPH